MCLLASAIHLLSFSFDSWGQTFSIGAKGAPPQHEQINNSDTMAAGRSVGIFFTTTHIWRRLAALPATKAMPPLVSTPTKDSRTPATGPNKFNFRDKSIGGDVLDGRFSEFVSAQCWALKHEIVERPTHKSSQTLGH